jgi:hypothetical protein
MLVKQRDLIRRIADAAAAAGVPWTLVREGGNHTVYRLGGTTIPVPRHREINEITALAIFKQCQTELGDGWWT